MIEREHSALPRSWSEAQAQGAKRYFTGEPCPHGHVAPRYTVNFGCEECLAEAFRQRYHADPERQHEHRRRWAKDNPEAIREYTQRDRKRHGSKRRQTTRAWKQENPDQVKTANHNRRARIEATGGTVTTDEWAAIQQRYGHRCLCCGETGVDLTMDHVVPISKGGAHRPDNIQPLCRPRNLRKHTKTIDYREAGHE